MIPALTIVLVALKIAIASASIDGSYVARTLNGAPVPGELRIPVTDGDVRLFRLEQGILRLSPDGRFKLHFRYHHQLVRRGTRPRVTPVLSDSESGTYAIKAGKIVFNTKARTSSRGTESSIVATIRGNEIRATYLLQDATMKQPITLELRRDERYW